MNENKLIKPELLLPQFEQENKTELIGIKVMRRKERYIYQKNLKRVRFKKLANFNCPCRKFATKALTAIRLQK